MRGGEDMGQVYHYIRASGVRKLVKEKGKRCGAEFLDELDRFVFNTVCRCLSVWNGSKKTLDRTVLQMATKQLHTEGK